MTKQYEDGQVSQEKALPFVSVLGAVVSPGFWQLTLIAWLCMKQLSVLMEPRCHGQISIGHLWKWELLVLCPGEVSKVDIISWVSREPRQLG